MPETEMLIGQGGALPVLSAVKPGNGPYIVLIDWAEGSRAGTTDVIDLAPVILTYKVFKPLRDDARLFSTVRVSEYGDAIQWGEDDTLAVSGETLERLAQEVMTAAQFSEFMKRNKLSLDAAAAQLGISRRMAAYYAKDRQIPRTVALACKQVEQDLAAPRFKGTYFAGGEARVSACDRFQDLTVELATVAVDTEALVNLETRTRDFAEKLLKSRTKEECHVVQEDFIRTLFVTVGERHPERKTGMAAVTGVFVPPKSTRHG
ncbi:hypothetical protein [Methylobacterium radiotolerans]|uniref:hypothetical protein n=1 Tax=Methylobacterium radiotolerans TaxID=31998 RepID=UPI00158A6D59|nr:hypothetical protein [Methylobacterium radiotolerans]